jgi:oxygen-independent coproporphyrinogen-3 oxidase
MASLKYKDAFVKALIEEIKLQKLYLNGDTIKTIYLGGGTPSLLSGEELQKIFHQLYQTFTISEQAEITIEANPDDIQISKIRELKKLPLNRISLGVQSFHEKDLKYLHRSHSAKQAYESVINLQDAGFQNLSIDFIFGIPTLTETKWNENLEKFEQLNIPHLSAYALTVEPKTALDLFIKNKKYTPVDETNSIRHFEILMDWASENNYLHYEISNYCKEGYYSKHNTNYWKQEKYLGLGPSAHSYNQQSRQWNISNVRQYSEHAIKGNLNFEIEYLDDVIKINEYIMVSLRTMWGLDLSHIEKEFGWAAKLKLEKESRRFMQNGEVEKKGAYLLLTKKGKLLADGIASEMFI